MQDSDDEEVDRTEAEEARINQRTIQGLKWIAQRTSAATKSLGLGFRLYGNHAGSAGAIPLVTAFSGAAHLSNLRFLTYLPHSSRHREDLVALLDWVLQQSPRIEVMNLSMTTRCLPASDITFQRLRHLVMSSDGFRSSFMFAEQLPVLESLLINGGYEDTDVGVIDMSGCKQLKRLVLQYTIVQELIWDTAGPCAIALEMLDRADGFLEEFSEPYKSQAGMAQQLVIREFDYAYDMLEVSPHLRLLTLSWADWHDDPSSETPSFASWMPAQPMLNLEAIIITGCTRLCDFPGPQQLPHLKELVIKTADPLEVDFEDAVATVLRLDSLHLSGHPLRLSGEAMIKLLAAAGAIETCGLVLAAATASQDGLDSSCIYLRPTGAAELSNEELNAKAEQLLQCRCGACFNCLGKTGCLQQEWMLT